MARRPTGGSAWSAPTRRCPSTRASPTSSWTCTRPASTSARCRRADRGRPVQRGVPRRRARTRRLRVGEVSGGWGIARLTLANERVSISSGATFGTGVESVVAWPGWAPPSRRRRAPARGTLLAEAHSLRLMTHRSTLRSLAGADPGPGGQPAQAARCRARAARPGARPDPARGRRGPRRRAGGPVDAGGAGHPVPDHRRRAPARYSGTSSPNGSSACPGTRARPTDGAGTSEAAHRRRGRRSMGRGVNRGLGVLDRSAVSNHELDWMDAFVTEEIEPLDLLWGDRTFHPLDDDLRAIVDPLKQQVRDRELWACHLGPELGGQGLRPGEAGPHERDPRTLPVGLDRLGTQAPTPAMPRSSPTTAPTSRRSATCSRSSRARSSPATR